MFCLICSNMYAKFDRANVSILCAASDFTEARFLWRRSNGWQNAAFFFSETLWRQVHHKKYTKTLWSWQSFVRAENDKPQKKGLKSLAAGANAKVGIIRGGDLLYLFWSCHTLFFYREAMHFLIKEVNHFPELWHVVWLLATGPKQVVIKTLLARQ